MCGEDHYARPLGTMEGEMFSEAEEIKLPLPAAAAAVAAQAARWGRTLPECQQSFTKNRGPVSLLREVPMTLNG